MNSKNLIIIIIILAAILLACNSTVQTGTDTEPEANKQKSKPLVVYGIDISQYQENEMDYLEKNMDTLTFVICRATMGITEKDPKFSHNWKIITEKKFIRGAYHFYYCFDDAIKQAEHFVATVGSFSANDLPPIIDFEETSVKTCTATAKIQKDFLNFLMIVESKTKRKPIIYTDINIGTTYLNDNRFSKYALYVADYRNDHSKVKYSAPRLPDAWKSMRWALWQESCKYLVCGDTTDFDIFNGNMDSLVNFIKHY